MTKTVINNLPAYAYNYRYVVAMLIDGEYWFWGAYNEGSRAEEVAMEEDGEIFSAGNF